MLRVGYNFDTLEQSFDKEQPIFIQEDGDTGIIAISLENAEQLLEALPKMVRDIKAKKYDNSEKEGRA